MKKIYLNVLLISFFSNTKAQNFQWTFQAGADLGINTGTGITPDNHGNLYEVATYQTNLNYGSYYLSTVPFGNSLVAKHDSSGNVLWAYQISGANNKAVSADALGNCYFTGDCGNATFRGRNNSSFMPPSYGHGDIFIAKYSPLGDILWVKVFGDSSVESGNCIKTDSIGNSYIAGHRFYWDGYTWGELSKYFVFKYDPNGNLLWTQISDWVAGVDPVSLDIDNEGNCYVTGDIQDTVAFGNDTLTSPSSSIFIAKYDSNGNPVWAKKAGTNYDSGYGITCDKNGSFYLTGSYSSPSTFGSTTLSGGGMFLAKYDIAGNNLWAKKSGALSGNAATVDATGNCLIVGTIYDPSTFGEGSDTVTVVPVKQGDFYVAKYDPSGNFLWVVLPGGSTYDGNHGTAICIDSQNNCFITGAFTDTTILGSIMLVAPRADAGVTYDICIAKLSNDVSTNIIQLQSSNNYLQVFPNPTNSIINVECKKQNAELIIYDTFDQIIHQQILTSPNQQIDLSAQPKGIYILEVGNERRKIVLN